MLTIFPRLPGKTPSMSDVAIARNEFKNLSQAVPENTALSESNCPVGVNIISNLSKMLQCNLGQSHSTWVQCFADHKPNFFVIG